MMEPTGQFWVEGKNLGDTIATIQRWARHTFPEETPERVMSHLYGEEHGELFAAFEMWKSIDDKWQGKTWSGKLEGEIADNIILLVVLADLLRIDVLSALQWKHKRNLQAKTEYHPELGYDKMVRPPEKEYSNTGNFYYVPDPVYVAYDVYENGTNKFLCRLGVEENTGDQRHPQWTAYSSDRVRRANGRSRSQAVHNLLLGGGS